MGRDFLCRRCSADPQPSNFASPRSCAFTTDGAFTPDNWNCVTLNLLADDEDRGVNLGGDDESGRVVPVARTWIDQYGDREFSTDGWLVLTRYKHRGCCSSAVQVGDFWPPKPLTYELAEQMLAGRELREQRATPASGRSASRQ